ncbi:hypothetical protein A9Q86_15635 [Flavobacteriales bacterium 33_180_T64]|nr:hypothetical protein A9Q86_15635 [Flavobacteriales bacterium 33_180_T64]
MIVPDEYNAYFDARNSIACATSKGSAILLKGDSSSNLSFSAKAIAVAFPMPLEPLMISTFLFLNF